MPHAVGHKSPHRAKGTYLANYAYDVRVLADIPRGRELRVERRPQTVVVVTRVTAHALHCDQHSGKEARRVHLSEGSRPELSVRSEVIRCADDFFLGEQARARLRARGGTTMGGVSSDLFT